MLRWVCLILVVVFVAVSVVEYVWHVTPIQLVTGDFGGTGDAEDVLVIRLGVAAWETREFPWQETIRRYEEEQKGKVRFDIKILPEENKNAILLSWANGMTDYDVVVAFADEEIHPFINYNRTHPDPDRRSLLVDVKKYLTTEQVESIARGYYHDSSRHYPDEPEDSVHYYEIPWMGEVMALNYNRTFFRQVGITKAPQTWAEVEAACAKLKGMTYKDLPVAPLGMYWAQRFAWFIPNCYLGMLAEARGAKGVADEKGRLIISGPEAVGVLETLKRWYQNGYITDLSFSSSALEQALRVQRTAMYCHWQSRGLWAVADLGADVIGIAPTPGMKNSGALISTYGCIFPKCSPVVERAVPICFEVFCTDKYGFQSGVSKGFIRDGKKVGGGKMPTPKAMYDEPDLPPGIAELGSALDKGYGIPDAANLAQCNDIFVVEFQKYIRGKTKTAEEVLETVRRRFAEEVYGEE